MEHVTAPFGRRALSLAMVATQVAVRDVEGKVADKHETFRSIVESRELLGVSSQSLVVLHALLSFVQQTALEEGRLVVFASNEALSSRSHGMPPTTLRRHVAALVKASLIIRRDSPNGKRFARRDAAGEIETAYGFDLTPLLARAEEFRTLAARVLAERRSAAMARERVTILRRNIAKMLAAGAAAGAAWPSYGAAFGDLCQRLPRRATLESLEPMAAALHALAAEVSQALEGLASDLNLAGNDGQIGAQVDNTETESFCEVEPAGRKEQGVRTASEMPLAVALKACPDIAMYARSGIETWRDMVDTAGLVSGMLGISPAAWQDARAVMGDAVASVAVAGILQRAEAIKNPGGYLRALTERSRAGEFSPWSLVMALQNAKSRPPSHGA